MPPQILIVDDMPDAVEFLPNWLQREGFDTVIATYGRQALALAEERRPDVILLDVMMPGMDGIETCRRLRMNPATANIPVILLSARSPSEARAEYIRAKAADYVTKPIQFGDLLERIKRIIYFKQNARQPDHYRLLEEMAYTALAVLPCNLAWLLVMDADSRWLVNRTAVLAQGDQAARHFLSLLENEWGEVRFPLAHGDNPLAEAVLNRTASVNIPAARFDELPGGATFRRAFAQFDLEYISLHPLVTSGRTVGVMVLAMVDIRVAESQRAQQILNSLNSQASIVVDNARLLADLAAYQEQMQAEQVFRQMVLDTMGEGLVVVDEEAIIAYANNRLLRMTGHSRESLYGKSIGVIFHPDDRERLVDSLKVQRRGTLPFSQQLVTRQGKAVPVLLSRVVIPAPGGEGHSTVMVVTDLSELQRNEEELKRQTQHLQAINRATDAISSARSLQEVVQTGLESALRIVEGVSASILLRDTDHPEILVPVAAIGSHAHQPGSPPVPVGEGLAGWVASAAKSQLLDGVLGDAQVRAQQANVYGPDLRSAIVVPLIASDEVIGVMEVINKKGGVFDVIDLEVLESLAGSTAIAIDNARLLEETRRRVTDLSTLLDASAAVSSTLDFGDVLERIARRLNLALQVERVLIVGWDRPSDRLQTLAEVVNAYWPPGHGPLREIHHLSNLRAVFEFGTVMVAGDVDFDETAESIQEDNPSGLYTLAGFPITIDGRVVGVVMLCSALSQDRLSLAAVDDIAETITVWAQTCSVDDWFSRTHLTGLCQQVQRAADVRWCSVSYWDQTHGGLRLLREVGRALWLEQPGKIWDLVNHYHSLARALATGDALTLQLDTLEDDPGEQAFLRSVGGNTCLVAPLVIRGESSGLVKLIDSKPEGRVFDNAELSLCLGIANVVANAMENAQLYRIQEQRASALEAAYTDLQEADRLKNELLQNLSHELQTPLTHILGYLRLLVDGVFGELNADQDEAAQLVVDKAQILANVVKSILTVQDADAHQFEFKPIHLERVVALAIRSVSGQADAQGIRIVPHIPANLPLAFADPVRVGAVFEELLDNAIKFSPNGTRIEVTLEDTNGLMLHASVRDYGIGLDPQEHEKIFRRFYQVDSGTTRRFGGAGLGLAIVRQIVEGHRGRVWVESALGEGSCFHLTLPKVIPTQSG